MEYGKTTVVIGKLLSDLRYGERRKPTAERRKVPTQKQIAALIPVSENSFSDAANGRLDSLRLDYLSATIHALREAGFDVSYDDLLVYNPPAD